MFQSGSELVRLANKMTMQAPTPRTTATRPEAVLRRPEAQDGVAIHNLVAACPPLDANSLYLNLLQCTHFADTCILAEHAGAPVGWISGYRLPRDPTTLFVWQVAVQAGMRGTGLARKMLLALLDRPGLAQTRFVRTTVTTDNTASRALFRSVARRSDAPIREESGFEREAHFRGRHDSERLIVIGPLPARRRQASAA